MVQFKAIVFDGVAAVAVASGAAGLGLICPAVLGAETPHAAQFKVSAASNLLAIINRFRGTRVLSQSEPAHERYAVLRRSQAMAVESSLL